MSLGLAVLVFLLSYCMTGRLCYPASKFYLLDHPSNRSLHTTPTPRTGGIAIISSLMVGLIVAQLVGLIGMYPRVAQTHAVATAWAMGLVLFIGAVSFWDDRAGLPPGVRFIVHGMAAAGLVWGGGVTVNTISVPLLGTLSLGWLAMPGAILSVMWMTNLYNCMDGMDGLAGGMTVLGFGFLSYVAWTGEHHTIATLALLISVAASGFLYYNMPPARIFMGDIGSVALGFLAGALTLMGVHDGLFDLWVPLLIFSPFVADATVTLIRRLLRGERVWQAHREHYYQRLVMAGWGHRRTMVAEYVLMLACGLSAIVYVHVGETWRLAILLGWIATYAILAWAIRKAEQYTREPRAQA